MTGINDAEQARLGAVANAIEKHPQRFGMADVVYIPGQSAELEDSVQDAIHADLETPCGTRARIAGWAIHLYPDLVDPYDENWETVACRILGLSPEEGDDLFWNTGLDASEAVATLRATADARRYVLVTDLAPQGREVPDSSG